MVNKFPFHRWTKFQEFTSSSQTLQLFQITKQTV